MDNQDPGFHCSLDLTETAFLALKGKHWAAFTGKFKAFGSYIIQSLNLFAQEGAVAKLDCSSGVFTLELHLNASAPLLSIPLKPSWEVLQHGVRLLQQGADPENAIEPSTDDDEHHEAPLDPSTQQPGNASPNSEQINLPSQHEYASQQPAHDLQRPLSVEVPKLTTGIQYLRARSSMPQRANFAYTLPLDLALCIMEDFLAANEKDMANLDAAYCNHRSRVDLLSLLAAVRILGDKTTATIGQIKCYLEWVKTRRDSNKVRAVHVNTAALLAQPPAIPWKFPLITKLHILIQYPSRTTIVTDNFTQLAVCLPNLKEIVCRPAEDGSAHQQSFSIDALIKIAQLEVVNIMKCMILSDLVDIARRSTATLRELSFDALCVRQITDLAALPLRLKHLGLQCDYLTDSAIPSILQLCAGMADHLEHLYLGSSCGGLVISFDLVLALTKACAMLQWLELNETHVSAAVAVSHCLTHCHRIQRLVLRKNNSVITLAFNESTRGRRHCHVDIDQDGHNEFPLMCSALLAAGVPIRSMRWNHLADSNHLLCLADSFGQHVEELRCAHSTELDDKLLMVFTAKCPHLAVLHLNHADGKEGCSSSIKATLAAIESSCGPKLIVWQ